MGGGEKEREGVEEKEKERGQILRRERGYLGQNEANEEKEGNCPGFLGGSVWLLPIYLPAIFEIYLFSLGNTCRQKLMSETMQSFFCEQIPWQIQFYGFVFIHNTLSTATKSHWNSS